MENQETSPGKLDRARLIGRLLNLRDAQAALDGPEKAKVVRDLLDVREKLGFANATGAKDAHQAEDVQVPKQGRTTNAEESAEPLKEALTSESDVTEAYVRPDSDTPEERVRTKGQTKSVT